MAVVAVFFKLSMAVRDMHNHLVEEKGVPSWASYSLFAGVTLALGCILGFFIVLIIDQVFPTASKKPVQQVTNSTKKENSAALSKKEQNGEMKSRKEKENVQQKSDSPKSPKNEGKKNK
uniref:Col_cuticle_N domain-containing protein n=1 Tax=Heterorhabditis bacteriophora TaxID=37862 RepID=A0A1I7XIQ1_HETBA